MLDTIGRLALVATLVIATVGMAGIVAADETSTEAPANATESTADTKYSLEELRAGGEQLSDSPPSVRVDGQRMWWVEHWPADSLFSQPGEIDDPGAEYLERGATVDRNSVWLRTVSVGDTTERTLRIVYWDEAETDAGEPVPVDVVEDTQTVEVSPGMPMIEVDLRESEDPRHVTMWIEGDEETVRWTFQHDSVATTEDAGISTRGDYLSAVALQFFIPIIIGSAISGYGVKRAIERVGRGPGYPILAYLIALAVGLFMFVWSQFSTLAEVLAVAPYLASVVVILVIGIVVLESQAVRDREVLFFKPNSRVVDGPNGEEARDALTGDMTEEVVCELPDGRPALVRKGIVAFVARWFGSAAVVPSAAFETRIKLEESEWDELIVVEPESDSALEYEPESFKWNPPSPEDRDGWMRVATMGVAIAMVVAAIGASLSWTWGLAIGAAAVLVIVLSPVDGNAHVEPADAHTRAAWITALTMETRVDDAKTLSKARQTIIEQQSSSQMEIQSALEEQDATLVESMLGDVERGFGDRGDEIESQELSDDPDAGVVPSDD